MFLEKLNIIQFKNLESVSLSFKNKINCFIGDNGAGKTNILDSIYYLSMCKSGFVSSDRQSVMHEKDFFVLNGEYKVDNNSFENIYCSFKTIGVKKVKRNDKEYPKLSEHIGLLPLVIVSPGDSFIISDSSEERRKYINQLISQIDKKYLLLLVKYNQLLAQRNALLKGVLDCSQRDVLEVIDMQIGEVGDAIFKKRTEVINYLAPIVEKYYSLLSGDKEKINIEYNSKLSEQNMFDLLQNSLEKDFANKYTTRGIHRDDIKMSIMGYPIRKYGSQGQQKSFIIALKLAQFDVITEHTGKKPILLLDDIFDKLDLNRVEELINIVYSSKFGQIFISDCNKLRLDNVLEKITDNYTIFAVKDSEVTICNEKNLSL